MKGFYCLSLWFEFERFINTPKILFCQISLYNFGVVLNFEYTRNFDLVYLLQAEIDSAAELVDFFRFNAYFAKELTKYQPISEDPQTTLNLMRYRSLEGFIASVSPFNFTAIAGNLAYTPAMMVNYDFTKKIHRKRKFTHPTSLFREMVWFGNPVTQPLCQTTSFIRFSGTPGSPMVWLILYPQMVPFLAKL